MLGARKENTKMDEETSNSSQVGALKQPDHFQTLRPCQKQELEEPIFYPLNEKDPFCGQHII